MPNFFGTSYLIPHTSYLNKTRLIEQIGKSRFIYLFLFKPKQTHDNHLFVDEQQNGMAVMEMFNRLHNKFFFSKSKMPDVNQAFT